MSAADREFLPPGERNARSRAIGRRLSCVRCAKLVEVERCVYCDACRPDRTNDQLLTEADRARMAELNQA